MTRRNFKSKIGIEKFLWIISERVVFQKNFIPFLLIVTPYLLPMKTKTPQNQRTLRDSEYPDPGSNRDGGEPTGV
jgi:hypothetical protein